METHFEHDLAELKQKLLAMASHTEQAVNLAMRALLERDADLALRVKANDDVIDRYEVEIDEFAINLLTRAPLAGSLRLITAAMKISQNLERAADEAAKIAKRARNLSLDTPVRVEVDLPRLARLALELLKASLDAFVQKDSAAARAVIPRDREVDDLNREITRQLIGHMTAHNDCIARCLDLITISRSLERIADHAKNVAEEVVYVCDAQDIRHPGGQQLTPPPTTGSTAGGAGA